MTPLLAPSVRFELPADLAATSPPEHRGLARDGVRLLVADDARVRHARFHDLPQFLAPGDLVVVNTSATLSAAVDGTRRGGPVTLHFSTPLDDGTWVVELRSPDGAQRVRDGRSGERIGLPAGTVLTLLGPHSPGLDTGDVRLWRAHVAVEGSVESFLAKVGRPISYGYLDGRWPIEDYQTVFASHPGSAEMPSAGRPFSASTVADLITAGVLVAPVTLHAGVSSLESGEPPPAERFRVPQATADLVGLVRQRGGRVIAVGTTVTRALESVAGDDGSVHAAEGWTDLVLGPGRPTRVIDGIVTGLHDPDASHLLLLEAVVGAETVVRSYDEALATRYLWHEFGDSCLLLRG